MQQLLMQKEFLTVCVCVRVCVFAELGAMREGHKRIPGEAEGVQEEAGAGPTGPPRGVALGADALQGEERPTCAAFIATCRRVFVLAFFFFFFFVCCFTNRIPRCPSHAHTHTRLPFLYSL